MTLNEAIAARHSVRRYSDRKIEQEKINALNAVIGEINRETGLHFQLITDEPEGFSGSMAHYGHFSGVNNYFVLAGGKGRDRDIGYYGERLVLEAQTLGLNTCWVALTFNKRKAKYELKKGEKLYVVISVGYGLTQGKPHPCKPVNEISDLNDTSPEWYRNGIEAVKAAPTAVNQQKFYFSLNGEKVTSKSGKGFYTEMDMGIAQYHFDIGSGRKNEWI
ncbi:MAG: nitroreductase [Clostridia bacterium]|nr:nitroreductase [Clostridia bacterium]